MKPLDTETRGRGDTAERRMGAWGRGSVGAWEKNYVTRERGERAMIDETEPEPEPVRLP